MMLAGMTKDPVTGEAYFADIDTFVSYTWRGPSASLRALIASVEDALSAGETGVRCDI
jgi:hypothetical protein